MPTSTRNKDDDTRVVEPTENQMFEREGIDRKGIRREFANTMPISLDDLFMERDDVEFVDPRTTDMPYGPVGLGEVGGTGVETLRVDGERWRTYRYTAGYEMLAEDAGNDEVLQRDAIMEQFDFLADANFLTGVEDQNGNQIRQGMFDWLKTNIPGDRTLDCDDFDGDTGDKDYEGKEEDILSVDAYNAADFRLLDTTEPTFDMMIGRRDALTKFNHRSKESDTRREAQSYWEILADDDDTMVGVDQRVMIPDEMQLDVLPDNVDESTYEPFTVDLTGELGTNEVIILPDAEAVADNYWNLAEMGAPETDTTDLRGMREAVDYVWRYSHKFDPHSRYGDAPDAFRLTNLDALFN